MSGINLARRGRTILRRPNRISGLVGWWKADAITGLADGAAVGTWPDSSGGGHDLTQATIANRPAYKVNIKNGRPVVRFSAASVNQALDNTSFTVSQPTTIIAVVVCSGSTTNSPTVVDGTTSRQVILIDNWPPGGTGAKAYQLYGGNGLTDPILVDANWHVFAGVFNGLGGAFRKDGTVRVSGDSGSNALTGIRVGNGTSLARPWPGDIAEVIIYNKVLSPLEWSQVDSYLADKYAITVADHS